MARSANTGLYSIVAVDKFIQATRDSGYKSTVNAVSELVDNSIQAGATHLDITIVKSDGEDWPLVVSVLDDGCGMGPETLRTAMRFGGSSRFNDRSGLGRYGMGLPNASLSQARRVEVVSWRSGSKPLCTYLDVDEIATGDYSEVPEPTATRRPPEALGASGTLVRWSRCDRLDNVRASTIARKLRNGLGRKFRYFLWEGGRIVINDTDVKPIDPLYLHEDSVITGAELFGDEITVPLEVNGCLGTVLVRFSLLPVLKWSGLSREDKRKRGISKGAGVSVVRAGREVDYGWFFMGQKRRENYDDWWRCEVHFDPVLDEVFGITHTKQQISPKQFVLQELEPDLERIAHALNRRVRELHAQAKQVPAKNRAEDHAGRKDEKLPPLPDPQETGEQAKLDRLKRRDPSLQSEPKVDATGTEYRLVEDSDPSTTFYDVIHEAGRLVVTIDQQHRFFRRLYRPIVENQADGADAVHDGIRLLLMAAARAEAALREEHGPEIRRFREEWSRVLATFLER